MKTAQSELQKPAVPGERAGPSAEKLFESITAYQRTSKRGLEGCR
jgi:hypothetical protein